MAQMAKMTYLQHVRRGVFTLSYAWEGSRIGLNTIDTPITRAREGLIIGYYLPTSRGDPTSWTILGTILDPISMV